MDIPQIDETKLNAFGVTLFKQFERHEQDRKAAEDRWLQNLRQFRGIYDPEVKIDPDCSKAYPKLTRWKIVATVARLMQMLFPNTEKNWGLAPSPLPELELADLQAILDRLVQERAGPEGDPSQVELSTEEIEKAVHAEAKKRAERMSVKIDDDLKEADYVTLVRKVVFSAALYNVGVLKGPLHTKYKSRTWERLSNGKYQAIEKDRYKPIFEFLPVWNWFPDMTATALSQQDGTFERHIMTRQQVEELGERPGFLKERIDEWLLKNKTGNHKMRHWETAMRSELKSDKQTNSETETRKYEVLSYWGGVTGADLRASGVKVKDSDVGKTLQASVWLLGNVVIKAALMPFGAEARIHHEFVFEEDDLSLLGNGLADTLRDSQLSLCEVTRSVLDTNSILGTQLEVNMDLLMPGQNTSMRKHKVWRREGTGAEATYPAVRNIGIDSRLQEQMALMDRFMDFSDKESGLPPASMGDVTGGGSEALRTQRNASMFLGAAALPIRDTVRNFDTFTTSVITALVEWNRKYDPDPSRDGDYNVIARGSTSLIAKEVLADSLDQLRATVTEGELPYINERALFIERMKARDLPVDVVLEDEDVAAQKIAQAQEAAQAAQAAQEERMRAEVREILTKALKNVADARAKNSGADVTVVKTILEALERGDGEAGAAPTGE